MSNHQAKQPSSMYDIIRRYTLSIDVDITYMGVYNMPDAPYFEARIREGLKQAQLSVTEKNITEYLNKHGLVINEEIDAFLLTSFKFDQLFFRYNLLINKLGKPDFSVGLAYYILLENDWKKFNTALKKHNTGLDKYIRNYLRKLFRNIIADHKKKLRGKERVSDELPENGQVRNLAWNILDGELKNELRTQFKKNFEELAWIKNKDDKTFYRFSTLLMTNSSQYFEQLLKKIQLKPKIEQVLRIIMKHAREFEALEDRKTRFEQLYKLYHLFIGVANAGKVKDMAKRYQAKGQLQRVWRASDTMPLVKNTLQPFLNIKFPEQYCQFYTIALQFLLRDYLEHS